MPTPATSKDVVTLTAALKLNPLDTHALMSLGDLLHRDVVDVSENYRCLQEAHIALLRALQPAVYRTLEGGVVGAITAVDCMVFLVICNPQQMIGWFQLGLYMINDTVNFS